MYQHPAKAGFFACPSVAKGEGGLVYYTNKENKLWQHAKNK